MLNKDRININPSSLRKFYYIIRSDKERKKILDEASFYKKIYIAVDDKIILETVIEKYIKMRLFNVKYLDNNKDIEEYKKELKIIYQAYKYNLF